MPDSNQQNGVASQLKEIYYNVANPGSYGGVNRLLSAALEKGLNVNQEQVENFLSDQASYSLHKPARKNFKRNPTVVGGIDRQWQADLADMQALSRNNHGYRYLLTVIDVFSKYAWVIPVKSKGTNDMVNAFTELISKSAPRIPEKIQTDAGKEFINKELQRFFKEHKITHFVTNSDKKAAVVERFNRTLKTRIWTFFTAHQTENYIDKLDEFVKSYNSSFHRSIGMKPADVKPIDQDKIWNRLYGNKLIPGKAKIKQSQNVRINNVKGIFQKGYVPNWSEEHFHVTEKLPKGKPVYHIADDLGEDIKGQFYEQELQPISENRYIIEKILKKRKLPNEKLEYFVKWKGWPSKFNSWISESEVENIAK